MKVKNAFLLSLLFTTLIFSACGDKDDDKLRPEPKPEPEPELTNNEITNEWIYKEMSEKYLWNDKLTTTPNYTLDPKPFFYGILYNYGQKNGDRFSWIESYEATKASASEDINLGFEYVPNNYFVDEKPGNTSVGLFVAHTRDNSDAVLKGLKRGHIIYAVDGVNVNYDNYSTILKNKSSFALSIYDENGIKRTLNSIIATGGDNSPVWLSKVIEQNGIKIGYLVYDQFERGTNGSAYKYDIELAQELTKLKDAGATEFVLDLRYNLGGFVTSAVNLASAFVPNRSTQGIFLKSQYNSSYQNQITEGGTKNDRLNDYFYEKVYGTTQVIPKMGVSRLFVLATENSASASEAIINGLKAHMPVIHIGTTTVGKDKGSINIEPTNSAIKWQLQPIVARITDSKGNGNYINGLSPDGANIINEWKEGYNHTWAQGQNSSGQTVEIEVPILTPWKGGFKPLGYASEPLLGKAISIITGIPQQKTAQSHPQKRMSAIVPNLQDESRFKMFIDESKFNDTNK